MIKKTLLLCLLFAFIGSCNPQNKTDNGKIIVVATTGMVADIAKNVGKDSIEVSALMGPGVDPHLYKATQGDLSRLQGADIIFYNGLHLEGKMGEVFEKLERIKTVVPIARGISETMLLDDPVYQGTFDPHIWFDVSLWMQTVTEVTNTLIEVEPESRDYFIANAEAYRSELAELHEWVINEIQNIPPSKRILITAHDAFNYFGRAYGIEVKGLQGISTLSEFGLKDRVDLINYIVEKQIKAVFVETSVSKRNIEAIVEGCSQKGHQIEIGGNLYSDAMGAEGTQEGTYLGMVRANVKNIVEALK